LARGRGPARLRAAGRHGAREGVPVAGAREPRGCLRGALRPCHRARPHRGGAAVTLVLATVLALLATGSFVQLARTSGWGKVVRDTGPASHLSKAGTPTMGGAAFLLAAAAAVLVTGPRDQTPVALILVNLAAALLGLYDDMASLARK